MRKPTSFDKEFIDNHLEMMSENYEMFKGLLQRFKDNPKEIQKHLETYQGVLEYLQFNVESMDIFLRGLIYRKNDARHESKTINE
ncbi:MAG: hypothetical protein ABIC91_08950 [Nanoarchaeota archaeon]